MVVAPRGILAIRCTEPTGLLEAPRTGPATHSAARATIVRESHKQAIDESTRARPADYPMAGRAILAIETISRFVEHKIELDHSKGGGSTFGRDCPRGIIRAPADRLWFGICCSGADFASSPGEGAKIQAFLFT
jgi:hypothetical protein